MTNPADIAAQIVREVMGKGSAKDGCDESWRDKPPAYHLGKAARHAVYAFLMYSGLMPADAEGWRGHLRNSITRAAMMMAQEE